jgi:farnesyl-diphosphate farnesyltransferase
LKSLSRLLKQSEQTGILDKTGISKLYDSINPGIDEDHKLLNESDRLFSILRKLPPEHQLIICRWVSEMAKGMAHYTELEHFNGDKIGCLSDIDDWNKYCYFVAGTVGRMLTDLFFTHYKFPEHTKKQLIELSKSFGLGLQKVNVIKDVPADRKRNVCYLPHSIMAKYDLGPSLEFKSQNKRNIIGFVNELLRNTIEHLDDAMEYTGFFPERSGGTRMFLILPVYLAVATVEKIAKNPVKTITGPPVKINRAAVTRLVTAAHLRIKSNNALFSYYGKVRDRINNLIDS